MEGEAPSIRDLRAFGLVMAAAVALVFGALLPWLFARPWPVWPWVVAALLAAWALAHPRSLRPFRAAWMRFAEVIGAVNNRILLGLVFFVLITPIGLVRRLTSRDGLGRAFEPRAASYRKTKARRGADSLERPF